MSAEEVSVADHFQGRSALVGETYAKLLNVLRTIGPVQEDPKKTSIHLVRSSALAGVEVRRDYLLVNLKSEVPIESPRISKSERLSARRYHQKVKLASPDDVDAELSRWLAAAYAISG